MFEVIRNKIFTPQYPQEYIEQGWDKVLDYTFREMKESFKDFPHGQCIVASARVERQLNFRRESGYFLPDWPFIIGSSTFHYWNIDPSGRIVDLTGAQFNMYLFPWNRMANNVVIMNPESRRGRKYLYSPDGYAAF